MSRTHPRGQPFPLHISDPYMKGAVPLTHTLRKHARALGQWGKEATRSQDQMRARQGPHVALTLGLVSRQGKSWSGASGRRMR